MKLCNMREDTKKKVHAIIDKFTKKGLHSLAVARQEVLEKSKESPGAPWQFVGLLSLFETDRKNSESESYEEWLEREDSVTYERDFNKEPVYVSGADQMSELYKNIWELKSILYGNSESEPVSEACAQLTQEFFRENTLRLLIKCLPKLNLEARKDATQVVANLQRQQVHSRLNASDYLETNMDFMDILIVGYKFSLAFENSNEEDYVTEKFFQSLVAAMFNGI